MSLMFPSLSPENRNAQKLEDTPTHFGGNVCLHLPIWFPVHHLVWYNRELYDITHNPSGYVQWSSGFGVLFKYFCRFFLKWDRWLLVPLTYGLASSTCDVNVQCRKLEWCVNRCSQTPITICNKTWYHHVPPDRTMYLPCGLDIFHTVWKECSCDISLDFGLSFWCQGQSIRRTRLFGKCVL
jgi:hypothetical protein